MKLRRSHLVGVLFLAISTIGYYLYSRSSDQLSELAIEPQTEQKLSLRDRIDLAMKQEFDMTKDPETGTVPRERLMEAYEILRSQTPLKHGKAAISGINWTERGPSNVGGRTRVIMFDANDATNKTVFAGSVSGGLWKTTDIFASEVVWQPVNDFFGNMAVTALAQDPSDPDIMYFGTGEGYYNLDAVRGDGVWKSTDGGDTWTQLSSTTGTDFDYVTKIVVDGSGNVVVGTRSTSASNGGIFRSTDNGTSFTNVLDRHATIGSSHCADIEMAADGSTFYAAMGIFTSDGIFKSTDSAKTWSRVYNATTSSEERIELACAPSNSNYIYAIVQDNNGDVGKIMKSTNGGTSWPSCSNVSWQDGCTGSATSDFSRGQAWYDLIAVVDPNDETTAYIGGIDLFRTTNSGTSWSQLSSWVGCGGYDEVHSDHHALVFCPGSSDTLLNGNDGGIYITEDASSSPPSWTMINNGYNVTQFYAGAVHPTALTSYFIAGAQDNGSQRFRTGGVNETDEVTGGDGAFCHIDQNDPDTQITAYVYNSIYVSVDGFATSTNYSYGSTGNFINPSDYDSDNKILYSSYNADTLLRWSNIGGTPSVAKIPISAMNGSQASAVLVSPSTPTTVYVGTEGGRVIKITSANSGSPSITGIYTGLPSSVNVSCIAEDPFDASHLLVTYSNYGTNSVWESTNGGSSWTNVEGDLPDMPVRWALFSPWGGDSVLLATELGVWSTTNLNSGSTSWAATNTGLANCRVDMLQYRASDSLIMAATHGRGVYTTNFFSQREVAQIGLVSDVVYEGDVVQFYDDSYGATSWSWDFENDGYAESTSQNPTYAFGEGGTYTVKLTINGTSSTTTTIQVLPRLGTPYTTSDGGDMESNAFHFGGVVYQGNQLWERGAPSNYFTTSYYNGSNAWVTDLDGDMYNGDVQCALLSPSFNFTASGTYTLSFVKSMEVQYCNGPFAVQVHYSLDGGDTWTRLGTDQTGTNWYERGPNSGCQISTYIFNDEMGWSNYYTKSSTSHDVSSLAGNEDVRFRVMFVMAGGFGGGYARAGFLVDDFAISGPDNDPISGAGIETTSLSKTLDLGPNDSADYYSSNGKLIASIWNQSSHDFGATTVEIDGTGTSAVDFDTNTTSIEKIFSKTIKITPTTNNTSSAVKIAMYYTQDEVSGWESVTGFDEKHIQLFKTTNAIGSSTISQGVNPSATVIDSTFNETGLCVTGTFSNGFSGVGAGGGGGGSIGGPLPVTLVDFNGKRLPDAVVLDWQTASEFNNSHFEVMRSVDGSEFKAIGRVEGKGTISSLSEYTFTDADILVSESNTLCYRLKQVDFDGSSELSKAVCLAKDDIRLEVVIGPNPFTNNLELTIDPWSSFDYSLEMFDLDGNQMYTVHQLKSENKLNMSSLPAGVYLAAIKRDGVTIRVEKLIKY